MPYAKSYVFGDPQHFTREPWQTWDVVEFFMVGVDGSRWHFGAPDSPVRLNRPPTGFGGAPIEHDFQELVGLDGAVYRGTQDKQLSVGLQVWIADAKSSAWARRQQARWRVALGRGKQNVRLYCVTKDSGYWWIDARVESVSEVNFFDQEPGLVGETGELVTLVTERSFWESFEDTTLVDFTGSVQILNRGSMPMWPKLEITGNFEYLDITIGSTEGYDTHRINNKLEGYVTFSSMSDVGKNIDGALEQYKNQTKPVVNPDGTTTEVDTAKLSELLESTINSTLGGSKQTIDLTGRKIYIDTDPLWPTIVTNDGIDLTPYLPDVRWRYPIPVIRPGVESKMHFYANLAKSPTTDDEKVKVRIIGTPRTEMPWSTR
ncbi:hypothetical protein H0194_04535 [Corynebacterium incognita]|uniref:Minor tail protein n=1 Tax=Corynebacterium incognita TaxID=2754725 RepID=A0A7G7CRN6_9CORY|nr:hypothetical protein [Corynebacterium incognita]QNE90252.1 hypothetical protein H0194_04535 [Corynebacterium incognita]